MASPSSPEPWTERAETPSALAAALMSTVPDLLDEIDSTVRNLTKPNGLLDVARKAARTPVKAPKLDDVKAPKAGPGDPLGPAGRAYLALIQAAIELEDTLTYRLYGRRVEPERKPTHENARQALRRLGYLATWPPDQLDQDLAERWPRVLATLAADLRAMARSVERLRQVDRAPAAPVALRFACPACGLSTLVMPRERKSPEIVCLACGSRWPASDWPRLASLATPTATRPQPAA